MPVAEAHPSVEDLAAFTLGTLDDESQAAIEDHVAACTSCQERAAVAPDDTLVELLRRVHSRAADTFVEPTAQLETPVPLEAADEGVTLSAVVPPSTSPDSDCTEAPDAIPPELARHPRYRIVRRIGSGGMGVVYKAEHLVMQRPVALKVIRRAYTAKADALERFRSEVRKAARLAHPNIVSAYDAEDAGETHFLVMEYVEGTDLGRLIQEGGPLPVDRACDYVRQAALGLQYAFQQGMVHCDLKPHNLMLTPDGRVKILDFGLARFASEAATGAGVTGTGLVLGTVDYIAPEQADNARQADIRSDIYSLGCTLYHLLAGQPPFPTGTSLQKVMAHIEKKPQPLTELRPALPEGFMPVLERMMAKNPKHRYQTPAEVAIALEPFTLATAVARNGKSRRDGPKEGDSRTVVLEKSPAYRRRRRNIVAVAAAVLFVLVGLLGAAVYRIATDKGELVITSESPDANVSISRNGEVVDIIDMKTGKQIRLTLRSGDYELELKGAAEGLKLDIKNARLTRGETVVATIKWDDKPIVGTTEPPPAPKPPDGAVASWPGNGDAKDSVGDNDGELKGGVTFSPGVAAKAFRLDGATRYVEVPRSDLWGFGKRDFSIELWVKFRALTLPNDGKPSAIFIGCDEGGGNRNKWFFAYYRGFLGFHIVNASGRGGFYAKADFSPDVDQWYHLAVTRSRGTFTIYVNGKPVASEKADIIIPYPDAPLTIGQAEGIGFFSGLIDEVAIYDRALSAAEVKERWRALAPNKKPAAEKVGEVVRRFPLHQGGAASVAISPDGRVAATGDGPGAVPAWSVRLWDLADGHEIRLFKGHERDVQSVAFSPDGILLASAGSHDQTVRIWEVATGKELHCLRHNTRVDHVAFLPDSRHVVSAGDDASSRMWDVKTGKQVRTFEGHKGPVSGVAVSPNGRRIASASADRTVRLWDAETGQELRQFAGYSHAAYRVAFSPDGRRLLSSHPDAKTSRLWDVDSGKEVREFVGHTGPVWFAVFTTDGRRALSSGDGTLRLWDVETGKELHCFTKRAGYLAVSPDGGYVLYGDGDGAALLRLPDPPPAEKVGEIRRFGAEGHNPRRVALSPDEKRLLTAGMDGTARYWDIATGKEIYRLPSNGGPFYDVAISPDGTKLLSCSGDKLIHVWDAATGKEVKTLEGHTDEVTGVAVSPDGRLVASSGFDCQLRVWNLDTGKLIASPGEAGGGQGVAFSPDGKLIATWAEYHTVHLWDVKDLKEVRSLEGHKERWVNAGAFSRDGSRLLTGTWPSDGNGPESRPSELKLWEVTTGKPLLTIDVAAPDNAHGLAISPDGRRALSCGTAGLVELWDLESGKQIVALKGHVGPVHDVAFLPDGRTALSAGGDGTIRLWRLPDPPPAKEKP
jgi:WD40 repeat protein/serine/threonine protein kinase